MDCLRSNALAPLPGPGESSEPSASPATWAELELTKLRDLENNLLPLFQPRDNDSPEVVANAKGHCPLLFYSVLPHQNGRLGEAPLYRLDGNQQTRLLSNHHLGNGAQPLNEVQATGNRYLVTVTG